jgi:hypothetical protein
MKRSMTLPGTFQNTRSGTTPTFGEKRPAVDSLLAKKPWTEHWRTLQRAMRSKRGAMVGREGYGNAGSMETVEKQLFPSFQRPLGNLAKGEIPTFLQPGRATTGTVCLFRIKNTKQRDRPLRGLLSLLRITLYWKCDSKSKKLLPRGGCRRGTTSSVLVARPLAGFEVTTEAVNSADVAG